MSLSKRYTNLIAIVIRRFVFLLLSTKRVESPQSAIFSSSTKTSELSSLVSGFLGYGLSVDILSGY